MVVSFVSCHWSCLQARSVHNVMLLYDKTESVQIFILADYSIVCRNRLKFALYNADRVNFKSRNYHVVAYNISILAEGLHFSALVH